MKLAKILSVLLVLLLASGISGSFLLQNGGFVLQAVAKEKQSPEDYQTGKIGVLTGSTQAEIAKSLFSDAELVYFSTPADQMIAVQQGKIDCYLEDETIFTAAHWEGANVMRLEEPVGEITSGFVFAKNDQSRQLQEEINAFLKEAEAEGVLDALKEKWLGPAEPTDHPDYSDLTGENGVIRLGVSVDGKPILYKYRDRCTGLEMEILTLFARQYGYAFDIEEVPFDSLITGLTMGRYDIAASSVSISEERGQSVDFSIPYGRFDVLVVVNGDQHEQAAPAVTFDDLENGVIGILTGSIYDNVAAEKFPNAERKYFSAHADMIVSMQQGRIDAIFEDETIYTTFLWEGKNVIALDEPVSENQCGLIFAKNTDNEALVGQVNEFIKKISQDGRLQGLQDKWNAGSEPSEHPDYTTLSGENGTLKIAVCPSLKPLSYLKGDRYTGFEIDFLTMFAEEYGYALAVESMAFDAIIPSVSTGKSDIGASGIAITEERAGSVLFSDPHIQVNGVAVVQKTNDGAPQTGFMERMRTSFEKTFIREDRWMLIASGIGVTMLISICAAAGGSALGFGLYMLSRSERRAVRTLAKGTARIYSRIVAGTPVVVILMILFYVVFAPFRDMSGIVVAIIGFSLTFGAFVFDHMTVSVNSVDGGQTEAAYALGYPQGSTFFKIIFPQAMKIFMPSYCGEAVSLVKATAVVGYIAVNDLTKMGDIIRSNTYEAFFPLIATALIYFMLTWLLAALFNRLKLRFEPRRRSRESILRGVNIK